MCHGVWPKCSEDPKDFLNPEERNQKAQTSYVQSVITDVTRTDSRVLIFDFNDDFGLTAVYSFTTAIHSFTAVDV